LNVFHFFLLELIVYLPLNKKALLGFDLKNQNK